MELYEAILTRRSIRKFTDYQVTDDEINRLLEAARWAPSWSNTQCWEFIIIRDRDMIKKITDTFSEGNPGRKASETASVLIAFCAKSDVPGFKEGKQRTKFNSWYMFDLGLAMQNIMLAAHDMGLASVIVASMDHDRCAELLNVKSPFELLGILPLGKPDEFKKTGPKRREIAEFRHREKFGIFN
jgi:nitroreductase